MKKKFSYSVVLLLLAISCTDYYPKPSGYFRIEQGKHEYLSFSGSDHFSFSRSKNTLLETENDSIKKGEGFNIAYPQLNAKIFCFYLTVNQSTLKGELENSRQFINRQLSNDGTISERSYTDPEKQVFSSVYYIGGSVASPIQFTVTDHTRHFFRGALYFNNTINRDSIAPALKYIEEDIIKIIETFEWSKNK